MTEQNKSTEQKSSKKYLLLILILLLLALLFLFRNCATATNLAAGTSSSSSSEMNLSAAVMSSASGDSNSLSSVGGLSSSQKIFSSAGGLKKSSAKTISSSAVPSNNTDKTPISKWEIQPIPGVYRDKIKVSFSCDEPKCELKIIQGSKESRLKVGESYAVNSSTTLKISVVDSVGNESPVKNFEYQILQRSDRCPGDMTPIGENADFCMDTYEWPNKKGASPKANVTLAEAISACESQGKSLCSSDEWNKACQSSKSYRYPYGNDYQENYCQTSDKTVERSGYKTNCRSWDGVQDLSGNLWEWTSTPARNKSYNLVAGGSWDSRSGSACGERKYSFFPQNSYPMVGFRCCKAAK